MITTALSTVAGSRGVVTRATLEHERDLYTGIELTWILQLGPKRMLPWREICRNRVRERADGPQEAIRERFGRLRYPVF